MTEDRRSIIHMRVNCDTAEQFHELIAALTRPPVAIAGAGVNVSGTQHAITYVGGYGRIERKGKPKGMAAAPAPANDKPEPRSPA